MAATIYSMFLQNNLLVRVKPNDLINGFSHNFNLTNGRVHIVLPRVPGLDLQSVSSPKFVQTRLIQQQVAYIPSFCTAIFKPSE